MEEQWIKEQENIIHNKIEMSQDNTNHPSYYNVDGYECWQVMESLFGKQVCALARLTNAFEYMWRSTRKGMLINDLKKAKHELELSDEDLELIDKYYKGIID